MELKMFTLALAPLIVWLGIFWYLNMIDKKLSKLEAGKDRDEL